MSDFSSSVDRFAPSAKLPDPASTSPLHLAPVNVKSLANGAVTRDPYAQNMTEHVPNTTQLSPTSDGSNQPYSFGQAAPMPEMSHAHMEQHHRHHDLPMEPHHDLMMDPSLHNQHMDHGMDHGMDHHLEMEGPYYNEHMDQGYYPDHLYMDGPQYPPMGEFDGYYEHDPYNQFCQCPDCLHFNQGPPNNGFPPAPHHMNGDIYDPSAVPPPFFHEDFELSHNPRSGRFFVIKSFTQDDVNQSVETHVWASTKNGNATLENAWATSADEGIYLFFSVNGSGGFCGVSKMVSPVKQGQDIQWSGSDRWKGHFGVHWLFVVDVPNTALKHLMNCEQMPVTRSRDTDEVPFEVGCEMMNIFRHTAQDIPYFHDAPPPEHYSDPSYTPVPEPYEDAPYQEEPHGDYQPPAFDNMSNRVPSRSIEGRPGDRKWAQPSRRYGEDQYGPGEGRDRDWGNANGVRRGGGWERSSGRGYRGGKNSGRGGAATDGNWGDRRPRDGEWAGPAGGRSAGFPRGRGGRGRGERGNNGWARGPRADRAPRNGYAGAGRRWEGKDVPAFDEPWDVDIQNGNGHAQEVSVDTQAYSGGEDQEAHQHNHSEATILEGPKPFAGKRGKAAKMEIVDRAEVQMMANAVETRA